MSHDNPPVSILGLEKQYDRLNDVYLSFSQRELEIIARTNGEHHENPSAVVDGRCSVIDVQDFKTPLTPRLAKDFPYKTDSDTNKYTMLVWWMLIASESGSRGGDACRQRMVLNAALYDALRIQHPGRRFEHLIGLVGAIVEHKIESFVLRIHDPDNDQLFFTHLDDELKRLFQEETIEGISPGLRQFGINDCHSLRMLLNMYADEQDWEDRGATKFSFGVDLPSKGDWRVAPLPIDVDIESIATTAQLKTTRTEKKKRKAVVHDDDDINNGSNNKNNVVVGKKPKTKRTSSKVEITTSTTSCNDDNNKSKKKETLIFSIPNFANCQGIKSIPIFTNTLETSQGYKWSLLFYPKGNIDSKTDRDYTGIYLRYEGVGDDNNTTTATASATNNTNPVVVVRAKACIRTKTSFEINLVEYDYNKDTINSACGCANIPKTQKDIIRDDLLNDHDNDGTLQINVDIEIIAVTTKLKNGSTKTTRTSTKAEMKKKMVNYMQRIMDIHIPVVSSYSTSSSSIDAAGCGGTDTSSVPVYDSCKEVCEKIKHFLKRDGVTKASFCRCIGNVNHNSLNRFLMKEYSGQNGCGMKVYQLAYTFFERMRMMEQQSKTQQRLKNESEYHPNGFSLQSVSMGRPPTMLCSTNPLLRGNFY